IYRTTRLTGAVHRLARSDEPELRGEAHAVLALVSGESPAGPAQGGGVHAWWRAQVTPAFWADVSPMAHDPGPDLVLPLDQLEVKRLRPSPVVSVVADPEAAVVAAVRGLIADDRLLTAGSDALGTALRADALLGIPEVAAHVDRLPPRLVARTALAEGELL